MLIVGMTGSGKTTFARKLLESQRKKRPIIILDSKPEPDDGLVLPGARVVEEAAESAKWKPSEHPVLVYRPNASELATAGSKDDVLDRWLQWCYATGDVLVYIDELSSLRQQHRQGIGLINLVSRGRSHEVGGKKVHTSVWMSSQAPISIPTMCYHQSNRIVVFYLAHEEHRRRVAADTHPELREPPRELYGFRLYDRRMRAPLHCGPLAL